MSVDAPIRIALIGAGSMGANHARVLADSSRARLHVVVDQHLDRATQLAENAGGAVGPDLNAVENCDAAILATPTETHVDIAISLLDAGKPVLIEKPVATELADVARLLDVSRTRGIPVMCGFVERFNPVISTALSLMEEAPLHVLAVRHSPQTPHIATSVVFDLLIHDIDLAFQFTGGAPLQRLYAASWTAPSTDTREVTDCTIEFEQGTIATLSASRASQRKIRSFSVATPSALIELDLLRADISVYRHVRQEQLVEGATTYRAETIVDIPFVRHAGEPLALQLEHFLDLLNGSVDAEAERRAMIAPHDVAARIEKVEM
jgi:predicted dehydrogenase